jgi:hypothetical protein
MDRIASQKNLSRNNVFRRWDLVIFPEYMYVVQYDIVGRRGVL